MPDATRADEGDEQDSVDVNALRASAAFRPYQEILEAFDHFEAERRRAEGAFAERPGGAASAAEVGGELSHSALLATVADSEHVRLTVLGERLKSRMLY